MGGSSLLLSERCRGGRGRSWCANRLCRGAKEEHLVVCDVESAVFMVGGRNAPAVTRGRALVGRSSSQLCYTHLLVPPVPSVCVASTGAKKAVSGVLCSDLCSNLYLTSYCIVSRKSNTTNMKGGIASLPVNQQRATRCWLM